MISKSGSPMHCGHLSELLYSAIESADDNKAHQIYSDADYFSRALLDGLMGTGLFLSSIDDGLDPHLDELRCLGKSISVTVELISSFHQTMEAYHARNRTAP